MRLIIWTTGLVKVVVGLDKEMSPVSGSSSSSSSIHRAASRPQLDLSGAAIQGNFEDKDPTILLPNQSHDISHLALDIGGSLIKLVYFSRHEDRLVNNRRNKSVKEIFRLPTGNRRSYPILGGRLHFVKFETHKMKECLDFIHSKQLHRNGMDSHSWQSEVHNNTNAVIKIGLSASTIASSFGKTISENKELNDYRPEDISLSLLRMISYNIGQIAYLNALRFGLKRIFFGCFFIRGHAYTMDTISFAVQFWSKGEAKAMFLRHECFLGALGAFMSNEKHGLNDLMVHQLVERFPMGAPYIGGKIQGPPLGDLNEKISWMEKFVQKGTEITAPVPMAPPGTTGLGGFEVPSSKGDSLRSDASNLNVGVLHLVPTLEVFPLLANLKTYEPNTIDLSDHGELDYWFTVLSSHSADLVDTAVASEVGTEDAKRRGDAFARAFSAHLARLMEEPAAYGKLGLANLLELREECLREFNFFDAYRSIKQRENVALLAVLPDLLMELDGMNEEKRLLMLIEGVLAANIFDWGSRACVDLYLS